MLTQRHRFHGYGSLRAVYRTGQTARSQLINLKFASRDPQRPYRVAVVVSRKVSKSAVTGNRIRGPSYEIVRRSDPAMPRGCDLVFTVFSDEVAIMSHEKLEIAISSLLNKASKKQPT